MNIKKRKIFFIFIITIFSIFFIVFLSSQQNKVVVTFQGYSDSNEVSINKNTKLDSEYVPKREGYKFVGWYYNDKLFDFDTKISDDITLVARWEKVKYEEYNIKFMVDNVVISSAVVSENERVSKPMNPIKKGYIFVGWYYNGKLYDFNKKVSKNMTLVAKFEKNKEDNLNEDNSFVNPPKVSIGSGDNSNSVSKPKDTMPPNDFVFNVDVTTHSIKVIAKTTDNITNEFNLKYSYAINGGEFQSNSLFEDLKANTKYIISVKVVDEAGNVRIVKREVITRSIKSVKIDSITPSRPTRLDVTLNVIKSSEFKLMYSIDGGKNWLESLDGKIKITDNCKILICNVDISGNSGDILTYNISNIDREKPNVFEPNIHVTTNSIIVDAETTDNLTPSDKLIYSYQLDNGEEQENGVFKNVSTGFHHLVIKVKDEAGNILVIEKDVQVSGVESPIIKVSKTAITNEDVILTLENKIDDYQLECKKEGESSFSSCEMPLVISFNQTLLFRYTDGVNYSTEVEVVINNIDHTSPIVNFDNGNLEYLKKQSMHFVIKDNIQLSNISYAISDSDKFDEELEWISVDGPFSSTKDMTVTLDDKTGKYYILVKATDTAGNLIKAVSPLLLVDNELPIVNLEKLETTTNSISIKVKANDQDSGILGYYYSIDGGKTFTSLQNTDSYIFKNLKDNREYSVSIKVQDKAGNEKVINKMITTKRINDVKIESVSTTKPTTSDVILNVLKHPEFRLMYSVDGGKNWLESLDGKIKITENCKVLICNVDSASNNGEILNYIVANIDREKPNAFEPNIHVTTNSIIVDAETTDNMTPADKLRYSYKLDEREEQENGVFKNVSTGVHHLVIKVKDEAGNILVIEKDVQVSGVESPIIKVSKTAITNEDVILTLENKIDDYQLECKKEGESSFSSCEMPLVISFNQTLLFRYTDGVNYSTEVEVVINNIDHTSPIVNFDNGNLEYLKKQSMHFVVSDNVELATISYAISNDDKFDEELEWISVDGPFSSTKDMTVTLDDKTGKYCVLVKATDTAGNVVKAVSPLLLLDNKLPIIDLEKTDTTTNSITIKVKANDQDSGILGYYYSSDGGNSFTSLQNDDTYTFKNLKNNTTYSISVKVQDKASNIALLKPISISTNDFKEVSIDVGEDKWTNKKLVTVNYPSTLGESYYYKIDDSSEWQPILEFPFKRMYTKNGKFSFMVSDGVNNRIDNVDIKKIDYINPVINDTSISDLDYNQVKLHVDATDIGGDDERSGILGYSYSCGNNVYSGITTDSGYFCTELEKDTLYDMGVLVYDIAGNVTEKKISVKTLPKYEGRVLPNTPEKLGGNNYFISDKNIKDYGFYLSSESWNKNVYTLNLGLDAFIGLASKGTVQYSIQFRNDTKLPMTDGDIKANITSNNLGYIKVVSSMLDKKVVQPGESVKLTVSIDGNFLIPVGGQSVQAIATYMLQGAEREFIVNINFI